MKSTKIIKTISKNKKEILSPEDLKSLGFWVHKKGGWWTNGFGTLFDNRYGGVYRQRDEKFIQRIKTKEELCTLISNNLKNVA